MKCLNPDCESVMADELNVSLNVSETVDIEEVEYSGSTEYGDTSAGIGTWCPDCEVMTFNHDYLKIIKREFRVTRTTIERGWAIVLPKKGQS
jgi:hypothetical protein